MVDDGYRSLPFPFEELALPVNEMRLEWSLPDLFGFLGSWSAVQKFIESRGYHPLREIDAAMRAAWGDPGTVREMRFPIHLRVGRV